MGIAILVTIQKKNLQTSETFYWFIKIVDLEQREKKIQ